MRSPDDTARARRLGPEDIEAFLALRRQALALEPHAFTASPEDDRALSPAFLRAALENPSQAIFGSFDGALVGIVGIYRDTHRKAAHKAHVWGLYVAPSHRGGGRGRSLLHAALDFARGLPGVTMVELGVAEPAREALALYESLGFLEWGREPDALKVEGRGLAERHMALRLERTG